MAPFGKVVGTFWKASFGKVVGTFAQHLWAGTLREQTFTRGREPTCCDRKNSGLRCLGAPDAEKKLEVVPVGRLPGEKKLRPAVQEDCQARVKTQVSCVMVSVDGSSVDFLGRPCPARAIAHNDGKRFSGSSWRKSHRPALLTSP